ncbi:MAG: RluA family pseudouridine synthase [Treponema sp.]|nr:RluA family pseudouridine synthase [Treponema sp.]
MYPKKNNSDEGNMVWLSEGKCRLDVFLREKLPLAIGTEVSNSKIRRLIVAGAVRVNSRECRVPSFVLAPGARVSAFVSEERLFYEKKPDDIDFELTEKDVLFEDEYIICVNKPAFLPTEETIVKGRGNLHDCVVKYLWKKNPSLRNPPYAGIMHRLDRETSGVILFTKSRSVNAAVHEMFEKHTAQKTYRAVCSPNASGNSSASLASAFLAGLKEGECFDTENFIGRISAKSSACKIGLLPEGRGGQFAKTHFVIASKKDGLLYVDAFPLTGRTHQIRVHLSQRGIPILGDSLYGGREGFGELGGRIMLHASCLEFPHPVTGEVMAVRAPLPQGFES